jgi:hypothetical protein
MTRRRLAALLLAPLVVGCALIVAGVGDLAWAEGWLWAAVLVAGLPAHLATSMVTTRRRPHRAH